jgi:uncharacterized membrane protein
VEEEDEDLIGLDPEEAARIRAERAAEEEKRKAEYDRYCAEGAEFLAAGSFKAAALKYEKALKLNEQPQEAAYGYWRAKTENFAEPDVLVEEYADLGVENLEFDLGYQTLESFKQEYGEVFERRMQELTTEEQPLQEEVEGKQEKRRAYLKDRLKTAAIYFGVSALPMLAALIMAAIFGMKITSRPDNTFVLPTIISAVAGVVFIIVFAVFTNKFLNAFRMYRANEDLSSTEAGERLLQIKSYKTIYEYLLSGFMAEEETEEIAE